ncbi:MAG: CHASE3 domain-containing protein [Betaproteobacteria bacterium]
MWTFGRKIAIGFALSIALLVIIGGVAYRSLSVLVDSGHTVTHSHAVIESLARVLSLMKDAETGQRGFVITGSDPYLEPHRSALESLPAELKTLRQLISDNPAQLKREGQVEEISAAKITELKRTLEIRRTEGFEASAKAIGVGEGKRSMDELRRVLDEMEHEEHELLKQRAEEAEAAAASGKWTILAGTVLCLVIAVLAGFMLTRSLTAQIGTAVGLVRSSSTELQAAANQQATSSKEQATAMNEITTTISELMATSRQIAESAKRVAQIAAQTAGSAKSGQGTVDTAQESFSAIRRQVDLIVSHMLELGKKSQQIGSVLDIVSELAEQTNILAINATIEAAGAGEAGRRFSVVAEEIRKLADRVGGSTKEIRALIDDVRGAVNTTVMTTESGSKAVDAGSKQFGDVAAALKQIAALVSTTTEAAREIELSTKQQSTAVEQVNVAIGNVAQTTKETEASSGQIMQTASQLTTLSGDLMRLVRPQAFRA